MKIAVVGTGIAGNVAAYYLNRDHQITVFEANDYVGGHTHTHDVQWQAHRYALDSGFIVFNDNTYPNFIRLLQDLDVPVQLSSMSFSVTCERSGLEYNGTTLNTLFAQRRNLLRPSFYRMIRDILRFNREAPASSQEQMSRLPLESISQNIATAENSSTTIWFRWEPPFGQPILSTFRRFPRSFLFGSFTTMAC